MRWEVPRPSLATNTLVLEGTGQTYRLGQQPNPDADLPVYELTEGNRTLVIHRLKNDIHADGMLLVYLPRERILIEGDPFTPGARAAPWAADLLEQVRALRLRIDRFTPVHGDVAPFAELERTVRAMESTARTQ